MVEILIQLLVLFFVIIDPLASTFVFLAATKDLKFHEKMKIASLAIIVALIVSFAVLLFGNGLMDLLNTRIDDIKVAGGIILGILGIRMALGQPLMKDSEHYKSTSAKAIASIIGTPLLSGPAAITTIIISTHDFGIVPTGSALLIILFFTGVLFYVGSKLSRFLNETFVQVTSTILGIITLAWAVDFIRAGLGF